MGVRSHLAFAAQAIKLELATAMEYRFNFVSQSLGMFINDMFWIVFWYILMQRFDNIGGWQYKQILMLYGVITIGYGIGSSFFANWSRIANLIEEGGLDYYLTMPKNVLLHALLRCRYAGFGDLLFGVTMAVVTISWSQVPLFLALCFMSFMLFLSWAILMHSISFYVGRFEGAARAARDSFMIIGTYPFSVYTGTTRLILLFVIPAGFVAGIPVELLTTFNWPWFLLMMVVTAAFFALSVGVFYKGLRRYESGNMMGMRG